MHEVFRKFSNKASKLVGSAWAFMLALTAVFIWGVSGPVFGFSDSWQLTINTSTTIITTLMVFIIQNTQNRDNEAIQLKLDELIRSIAEARNSMLNVENLSDDELKRLQKDFDKIVKRRQVNDEPDEQKQRSENMAHSGTN